MTFYYVVSQYRSRVEAYIDGGGVENNKKVFDELYSHRAEIESDFGGELFWQRLDDKRSCRISYPMENGGYKGGEEVWPALQEKMIEAMVRFENALTPYIHQIAANTVR